MFRYGEGYRYPDREELLKTPYVQARDCTKGLSDLADVSPRSKASDASNSIDIPLNKRHTGRLAS